MAAVVRRQGDSCTMAREGMIEYSYKNCGISNNGTDDIMFEDVCRCMRPRLAMPTTRNQTRVPAAFFDSDDESDFEVF